MTVGVDCAYHFESNSLESKSVLLLQFLLRHAIISLEFSETRMKPSLAIDQKRSAVREATTRFRAANPRVFGSVLHGNDLDGSDLDLLVDALPGATLFDLGGLQIELEEILGVPVDLLTPDDIPLKFRDQVLAEARAV